MTKFGSTCAPMVTPHREVVQPAVLTDRGRDAQSTAHDDRHQERDDPVGQCNREALRDDVIHRTVFVFIARAKIELGHDAHDIVPKLFIDRLIQPIFRLDIGEDLRRQGTFRRERPAGRGLHQPERGDQKNDKSGDRDGDPAYDKVKHLYP